MKKFLSLVLALALVLSISVPAYAKSGNKNNNKDKNNTQTEVTDYSKYKVSDTDGEGISLLSKANDWFILVENDFFGEVAFHDNHTNYTENVEGNGLYPIINQSKYEGQLKLGVLAEEEEDAPVIVGTRTVVTTTFVGYAAEAGFLANQKNQQGPKANYITAEITETYTVLTEVYDVWSDGSETLNSSATSTEDVVINGKSDALPNGAESNLVPTFENGLEGYGLVVSYKGNGNKFSWSVDVAPEREVVVETGDIEYFE